MEVRLLAKKLSKEDIRKYNKFETLATTLCDQQEALDEAQRRYDELVQSSSAQIARLTRSHEAKLEYEVRQAAAQVAIAIKRLQANEAQAQLRLQEQAQRTDMLISELRRALQETADQAIVNTRTASELEVHLRKELLEARYHLAELEPAWEVFIAKHNDDEEAREQEQRRRAAAAVTAQPSERRIRRPDDVQIESSCDCRRTNRLRIQRQTFRTWRQLAAWTISCLHRLPSARHRHSGCSRQCLLVLRVLEIPVPVDSDVARVTEFSHGIQSGRVQEENYESTGFSRRHSCVEKSLSRTLCARPRGLTSRQRH